ncbi:MAG: Ig-like domain-containing protein [Candidatus Latescibacteria bacterium]|nr:Ig-like domain-containing protein [Candidatus Latescibacterota bacterium]
MITFALFGAARAQVPLSDNPSHRIYTLPRFHTPPTLDGHRTPGEWDGALRLECSPSQIARDGATYGWRNALTQESDVSANQLAQSDGEDPGIARTDADYSSTIWQGWDDQALYFTLEVRDNIRAVAGNTFWWTRDGITIYLDLPDAYDGEDGAGSNHVLDRVNFTAAPRNSSPVSILWEYRGASGEFHTSLSSFADFTYAFRDAGSEFGGNADYVIEAMIPWEPLVRSGHLPSLPRAGSEMGFSLLLIDPDLDARYGGQLQCVSWVDEPGRYADWRFADSPTGLAPPGSADTLDTARPDTFTTPPTGTIEPPLADVPFIVSAEPGVGAQDVDPEVVNRDGIRIWFSRALDTRDLRVRVAGDAPQLNWPISVIADSVLVIFRGGDWNPALTWDTTYDLQLVGLRDRAGNPIPDLSFSFRTSPKPTPESADTTPPHPVSSFPADGAMGVDAQEFGQQHLRVVFDEPIGVDEVVLHVERNGEEYKWSAWLVEERTLSIALFEFEPSTSYLEPASQYRIAISGVRDLAGNVAPDISLAFATLAPSTPPKGGPSLLSSYPINGAADIDAGALNRDGIRVWFSEPLDTAGVVVRLEGDGVELGWPAYFTNDSTLVVGWGGRRYPAIQANTTYHLTLSGVRGRSGSGHLDMMLSFTTRSRNALAPVGPYITTVAGNGRTDFSIDGLQAIQTSLPRPYDLCVDNEGTIYFTDLGEHLIRRIEPSGYVSTVVRSPAQVYPTGGGLPSTVDLSVPISIFADKEGGLYFPEWARPLIYKVDRAGKVSGVVGQEKPWWAGSGSFGGDGGFASQAVLSSPGGVVLDGGGNLFVADTYNHRVRRVDAQTQIITTVAGSGKQGYCGDGGPATEACLNLPLDLWVDGWGDLYISDVGNHRVRRLDTDGMLTTVAGNGRQAYTGEGGPATQTGLIAPKGIFVDAAGNLFIVDDQVIRKVDTNGTITTVAGNGREGYGGDGGLSLYASFNDPRNIFGDRHGDLYVADEGNHRIRKITGLAAATPIVAASYPFLAPRDTTPPAIRATSPALAGLAANPGTLDQLYVAFTEPVDPMLQVQLRRDSSSVGWTFWVAFDSLVVDRGRAPQLAPNTAYELELRGVRDLYGNPAPDRVLAFTTGNTSADTILPPSLDTIAVVPPDSLPPVPPDTTTATTPPDTLSQRGAIALDFDLAEGDQGKVLFDGAAADRIVDLQLLARDLPEITGWSAVLVYDPAQLRFLSGSFQPGPFLPGMIPLSDTKEGQVEVGGALLGASTRRSGSGTLGLVSFEVLAGFGTEATLTLTQVKLRRTTGQVASDRVQVPVHLVSGAGSLRPPTVSVDFDLSPGNQEERLAAQADPVYTFQLHLAGAPALTGWSAAIDYDPLQVRYVGGSFQPGDLLPGLSPLVDDREGRLTLGGAVLGARSGSAGSGQLGQLSFATRDGFLGSAVLRVAEFTLRLESGERYRGTLRTAATIHHAPANLVLDLDLAEGDQQRRSVKNVLAGAAFPVQLYLYRTLPIRGWGATLRYDPQSLRYRSGSFVPSSFVPGLVALVDEGEGQVILGGSTLGTDGSGSGDGPLGTLVFEVLPGFSGSTHVEVAELSLRPLAGSIFKRALANTITLAGVAPPSLAFDFDLRAGDQEESLLGQVLPGRVYTVQLLIHDTPPISGWSAAIGFDPEQVRYVEDSFRPGDFIPGLASLVSTKRDSVIVGGAVLGSQAQNSGSGVLGQLSFEVLSEFSGYSWLDIPGFTLRLAGGAVRRETARTAAFLVSGSGGATAVEEESTALPATTALLPGYPNPFNTTTLLPYQLAEAGPIRLEVYGLTGQRLRTLVNTSSAPGYYQVSWPGTDDQGRPLASGVYLVRLEAGTKAQLQKLMLLR